MPHEGDKGGKGSEGSGGGDEGGEGSEGGRGDLRQELPMVSGSVNRGGTCTPLPLFAASSSAPLPPLSRLLPLTSIVNSDTITQP